MKTKYVAGTKRKFIWQTVTCQRRDKGDPLSTDATEVSFSTIEMSARKEGSKRMEKYIIAAIAELNVASGTKGLLHLGLEELEIFLRCQNEKREKKEARNLRENWP